MLRKLWADWQSFARAMGGFQSRILLGVFYFVVVTPFGLLVRLFNNPLAGKSEPGTSHWLPRSATGDTLEDARRQF